MNIVHITSEWAPTAKIGGLADCVQGLASALAKQGENISVFLPFYSHLNKEDFAPLEIALTPFVVAENGVSYANTIWKTVRGGVTLFLIAPHSPNDYFDRGVIYGEKDDTARFCYFAKVTLDYLLRSKKTIDILHVHDWITGICAPLYKERYRAFGLQINGVITTLHNLFYQGICPPKTLARIGLPSSLVLKDAKMRHPKRFRRLNILKGAIVYSDFLTTVSPSYCREIQYKRGFGLGPLLTERDNQLQGILNGIDVDYWNPSSDPYLKETYPPNSADLINVLRAKKANRAALSLKLGLKERQTPLIACVTRLAEQKGPALIQAGLIAALQKKGQAVLLGSIVEKKWKKSFLKLQQRFQGDDAHFYFGFDEALAHLIFAAADLILIPSLFEPCGLTQMIALRYGTLPLVHRVGGLKDTVFDADNQAIPLEQRNGYTFPLFSQESLRDALDRAFHAFSFNKPLWHQLMSCGMQQDWSWKRSAASYLNLYRQVASQD